MPAIVVSAPSGVLLKMEVGIRKGAWRRAWRYPAYLWLLRRVYAVKKTRRLVYGVYLRRPIPPPQYITVCTVVVVWSYEPKSYGLVRLHRNTFLRIYYLLHLSLLQYEWAALISPLSFFKRGSTTEYHVTRFSVIVQWTCYIFVCYVRRTEINYNW